MLRTVVDMAGYMMALSKGRRAHWQRAARLNFMIASST
jgi:hypothetical protein